MPCQDEWNFRGEIRNRDREKLDFPATMRGERFRKRAFILGVSCTHVQLRMQNRPSGTLNSACERNISQLRGPSRRIHVVIWTFFSTASIRNLNKSEL